MSKTGEIKMIEGYVRDYLNGGTTPLIWWVVFDGDGDIWCYDQMPEHGDGEWVWSDSDDDRYRVKFIDEIRFSELHHHWRKSLVYIGKDDKNV